MSSTTTPGIDVISFPHLAIEPDWLDVPMLRLVIEIIYLLQDVL